MKLHHFSLIFLIISFSFLLIANIETRTYIHVTEEKKYLNQVISKSIDDAMLYFVEEEGTCDMQVNKERVINVFLESLYSSLNINNPSEREELKFYIPVMLVTSMDGFYVYFTDQYQKESGQVYYKKQWSEKYPFYYEDDDFIYRFTLGDVLTLYDKNGLLDTGNGQKILTLSAKDLVFIDKFAEFRNLRPNSFLINIQDFHEVRRNIISNSLESVLNEYCNKHNEIAKKLGISYVFHLPSTSSEIIKAIESPSLLVFMQGYPLGINKDLVFNRLAISSSQVIKRQLYVLEEKEYHFVYHKKDCIELLKLEITQNNKAFYSVKEATEEGAFSCSTCIY